MNEFNGPANYALMELLITSLVLSASSDRFFTSSYISFLYLEKKKIPWIFFINPVSRNCEGKTLFGASWQEFWALNYHFAPIEMMKLHSSSAYKMIKYKNLSHMDTQKTG
jgi:hypothetical protein